jgi:hypothetical protein
MIAWHTSHINSFNVICNVRRGFNCEVKHARLFDGKISEDSICYGILRGCEKILKQSNKDGYDYWHIDNGYIGGDYVKDVENLSKGGCYRISRNNTQAIYIDHNYQSDRAKFLDIKLRDWKNNKDGVVLILPPTEAISKYYNIDIDDWIKSVKDKIDNRPYKIRTKEDRHIPLESELDNSKCLISYNSNAALESVFYGVPSIITSENSILKKWNNLNLDDIDSSYSKSIDLDRNKLINFISYHQFTLEEISNGVANQIIKKLDVFNLY